MQKEVRMVMKSMKNKIIFLTVFLLLMFCIDIEGVSAAPDFFGGIGSGSASMGNSEYCNDQSGCVHNEKGVRVTLVDKNGNIISGTHSVDYWNNIPSGATELSGSTFKSQYMNGQQISLSLSQYSAFVTTNTTNIGGVYWSDSTGFHDQHDKVERLISTMDVTTKESCQNTMPGLFKDLGWNNVCEELFTGEDCKDTMKNAYILLEPLFYINFKKNNIVVTGTEYTYLIYTYGDGVNWIQRQEGGIVYNLAGAAGYGNALVGMYLAVLDNSDDRDYEFNANGYKYRIWTETSALSYSRYYEWVHTAAFGRGDTSHYPAGSSMQLVWLGKLLGDKCKNEKCCIPCDPKDQACIEAAGDNWHEKDPYCCYETGEISEDGTLEACIPAKEYWKDKQDLYEQYCTPCCKPSASNNYCCDESNKWICDGSDRKTWSEFWSENEDLYEQYCTPGEDKCEKIPTLTDPEIDVVDCDDDNTNNISHFRDPVFNSENGQFKDFNSIKKIVDAVKSNGGRLPDDWLEKIATEDDDNTFAAIVYGNNAGDERYTTEVNRFCKIHCQEIFEVELPDNYPYVNAGRYFNWTIKDSKKDISKASAAKLCAMDVDLDKAIDSYLYISQSAALALQNEIAFQFNGHTGVGDVSGGNPYGSCDEFRDDYVAIATTTGGSGVPNLNDDKIYIESYSTETSWDCRYCCEPTDDGCARYCPGTKYIYGPSITKERAAEILYNTGKTMYVGSLCYGPGYKTDYRAMGESPNGTDGVDNVTNTPAVVPNTDYNGKNTSGISPKEWCTRTLKDYNTYVKGPGDASQVDTTGFSSMIYSLYSDMKQCNDIGEALMDNVATYLEIDMGLELKYQTLFKEHSYSTEDDDIVSEFVEDDKYHNSACFYHEKECEIDLDGDGRNDTPFYMDSSSSLMQKGGVDKQLTCDNIVDNWGVSQLESWNVNMVENPNSYYGLGYNPDKLEMLSICNGNLDGTFNLGCNKISGDESVYKFYDDKISYWSTAYVGFMSASNLYQLDKKINACVCKDGEILNKEEDGSCSCLREVSYKGFKEEYNNYQELPDGTLSVEFMNGSGLYPISLRYWHIGSIDENGDGHFDQFLDEYSNGKCSKNDGCMYGDPNGVCRFVIKNRIIASPDDSGICVDPPCDDDDDDDIGDYGECITDDDIDPDCRNVSGLNVIYRVIDLDNPFPGSDGNARQPGENWVGKENLITENRDANGMGVYSLEPLYSITLTPAAIKEIRKDNHENMDGDYLKGTLVYPSNSPNISGGGYSLFIHEELESIAVNYGGDFSIKIANDDRFSDILKTR